MQDFVNAHYKSGAIFLLAHGQETVERAVKEGNPFFVTILQHGLLLYGTKSLLHIQNFPVISLKQVHKKASQAYQCRYELAFGFLYAARECLTNGYTKLAVFQLHQAVEQACSMLVNVFLGYRSDIHHIGRLLRLCGCFQPQVATLFPQRTCEEARLFRLLCKSYSEARYKPEFKVTPKEANELTVHTELFVQRAGELCQLKLDELEKEVQAVEVTMEVSQNT